MIIQTLCIVYILEKLCDGWLHLRFKLRVEVGDDEITTWFYARVITNRK